MNILMIYNYLFPVTGGIESHVENLLNSLFETNIFFLTLKEPKTLKSYEKRNNVSIFRVKFARFFIFSYLLYGAGIIRRNRIDVLHAHTLGVPTLTAIVLGKIFHKPVVLTIHESGFIMDILSRRLIPRLKYKLFLNLARRHHNNQCRIT